MDKQKTPKWLNIVLWVVQILLAGMFAMAGFTKISSSMEELAANGMGFVENFSPVMVRFIGWSEVLGSLGLILPAATRIKPILTPLAAIGIATIMVLATGYHIIHSEPVMITVTLLVLALIVIWGRLKKAPIQAR